MEMARALMRPSFRLLLLAVIVTGGLAGSAVGQIMAPGGLAVCRTEIRTLCKGVEAGAGKRLACLAANRDALSAACAAVVEKRGPGRTSAQEAALANAAPLRACRAEVQALCPSVLPGGGARIRCLRDNAAKLGPTCTEALAVADAQRKACAEDGDRLCGTARAGRRQACLIAAKDKLSPACAALINARETRSATKAAGAPPPSPSAPETAAPPGAKSPSGIFLSRGNQL
jgi:hypothetical protein